jgi:ThiF family
VLTWVGWQSARDVLKTCDIIFGCTDDHDGRMLLNRLAYFYGIPLIDVGLRMRPAEPPLPYNLVARVSTILPGHACLLCRGLVDPQRASAEDLARSNPAEFARRKAEAYVEDNNPDRRPRWRLTSDWFGRPSIEPSVRQMNRCRSPG